MSSVDRLPVQECHLKDRELDNADGRLPSKVCHFFALGWLRLLP